MRLVITGANGFVGQHVVRAAVDLGHKAVALIRPAASTDGLGVPGDPAVEVKRLDLRAPAGLTDALDGADAVIHLAAAKSGDFPTQFAGTVVATENLLAAMTEARVRGLVGISSFSVYDYQNLKTGAVLDERSPIDTDPRGRDDYARTKLIQEDLFHRFRAEPSTRVVVLRPGMIYGPDNLWHALLGAELGPLFLRIGSRATLPLTYVENCARAMILAAERVVTEPSPVDGQVINIVDDDLPTQGQYIEAVRSVIEPPRSIPVPWPVMRAAAGLVDLGNQRLLDGRAKLPGIVVPGRLHARFKPLRFPNDLAKRLLGWQPEFDLAQAIARSAAAEAEADG